jgi:hypothetical protein
MGCYIDLFINCLNDGSHASHIIHYCHAEGFTHGFIPKLTAAHTVERIANSTGISIAELIADWTVKWTVLWITGVIIERRPTPISVWVNSPISNVIGSGLFIAHFQSYYRTDYRHNHCIDFQMDFRLDR